MENQKFTYYLPTVLGEKELCQTDNNSLIIIGANGSGKSKLGAWIERQDMDNIHRIAAQRNLNFHENLPLKNYTEAENLVLYGYADKSKSPHKFYRWGNDGFTTKLIDDFDNVLAALIALKNNENSSYVKQCKTAVSEKKEKPDPPITVEDKLIEIWNEIFPQRQLKIEDDKFFTYFKCGDQIVTYSSTEMSDGERAVLYLSAQVLCAPPKQSLIIDEPEVHLHRSIMNRLWDALERYRSDCFFIYITHDTQFVAAHKCSDKIWIKDYDGKNWKLEKIIESDLPEELLFEILGSRKSVLFVEGERSGYDAQLYSALYPKYYVVPCGSCSQVVLRTQAFRRCSDLHHCKVYGLIDRDYRSDYEIEKYKNDGVYTIGVAEVENLFIVKEVIQLVAEHFGLDKEECFNKVQKCVIDKHFASQVIGQIHQSVVANLKYQLNSVELFKENLTKQAFDEAINRVDFERTYNEQEAKFQEILKEKNYDDVIKVFNQKKLLDAVGDIFGLKKGNYSSTILNMLNTDKRNDILNAIDIYLPVEIPR